MKPLTQISFRYGFVRLLKHFDNNMLYLQNFIFKFCNFMKRIEQTKNENPHFNFIMFDRDWTKLKTSIHKFVVPNIPLVDSSLRRDFELGLSIFDNLEQHLTFKEVFVDENSPLYAEYTRLRKKESLVETCPEHQINFSHRSSLYNHIVRFHM